MLKKYIAIALAWMVTAVPVLSGCASVPNQNNEAPTAANENSVMSDTASEAGSEAASEAVSEAGSEAVSETGSEAASSSETASEAASEAGSESGTAVKTGGGKPWIDSELKENISEDTVTDPKDDFHLYANKEWLLNNNLPDGYSSWSPYDERYLEVRNQCMELLKDDSLTGHDAELVQTYYNLILDWDARNERGVSDLLNIYDRLMSVEKVEDITGILTDNDISDQLNFLFEFGTDTGLVDPDNYLIFISAPSVLLRDSAEYSKRTEYGDMVYGYKKDLFVFIAEKMGMASEEAEKCFDGAVSFETKLAERIYSTKEKNNEDYYDKINNEMKFEDTAALAKVFPLGEILTSAGYKYDGNYIVQRPDYFELLDRLYVDENIEEIRDLMLVDYVLGYSGYLDKETYDKKNELYNAYFGVSGTVSDEEMAYDSVAKELTASMQKVYLSKYGSAEDKKKMEELCRQVIDTYRELLSENDWLSDEVKNYAVEKLDHIRINAAYPEKIRDTSKIDISGCTLIEAKKALDEFSNDYDRSLIGTARDKDMWAEGMDILDCNAFYNPSDNSINMIIGMMGQPFYSSDMSTEELYASIGAFWVGHEVSHAFDSVGAQFDAEGKYRDWWTEQDKEEFRKRMGKLDDYLDTIIAFGDKHFIGSNIDTEMLSDMTGLQCALRMAQKIENFDYDRFFTKYAQMNARIGVYSDELSTLMQDVHPLEYSRTNVPVQQFEEFYKTYDIKEGDNMYLAPEKRLVIW